MQILSMRNKEKFLNTYIDNVTFNESIEIIESFIKDKKSAYVVTINTDFIVKMEDDKYFKEIVDNSDLAVIDGKPLIWISKFLKQPIKEKISGSDLTPRLLKVCAEKGYKVFIIGGKEGVADKAKENVEKDYKNINIVGTYCPKLGFEKDQNELDNINSIIKKSKADIVLACLGCPKQEKWMYENYKKYGAYVSLGVGATVDFLAGNMKRAPKWISDIGFEWLYRFFQEPRRLFKRYFVDDIKIFKLAIKYGKK